MILGNTMTNSFRPFKTEVRLSALRYPVAYLIVLHFIDEEQKICLKS